MTELQQFTALRTWLLDITGLPEIIRAHPDAPRPQGNYGMLNFLGADRVNWPDDIQTVEIEDPETDGFPFEQIPIETFEASWSFHVYGPGQLTAISRVKSAERSDAALLQLHPLVLHRTSRSNSVPDIVGTTWEDRLVMTLFVHYRVEHAFGADVAESLEAQVTNEAGKPFGTASAGFDLIAAETVISSDTVIGA